MKVWPFLFSRGFVLDNQLVVCPRVLKDGGRWAEFSRVVARLPSDPGQGTRIEEVQDGKLGAITLIYREAYASRNGKPARDVAGRPVLEIRGLMIEGRYASKASSIAQLAMDEAAPSLNDAFEAFWDQTNETGPTFSESFEVGATAIRGTLPGGGPVVTNSPNVRYGSTATAVALAALVPLVLLGGLFYWHYSVTTKRLSDLEAATKELDGTVGTLKQSIDDLRNASRPR